MSVVDRPISPQTRFWLLVAAGVVLTTLVGGIVVTLPLLFV